MWTPKAVTFGIRHERIFGFLGRAGDIIDAVRRAEGGRIVPSKLFSKVQWPNPITARALNEDESLTVDFNIEGIILNVDLEAVKWSRQRAKDLFLELARIGLEISGGQSAINRIGIVDNYVFKHAEPGEMAVNSVTMLQGLGKYSDFTLRASFRTPTDVGLVQAGVDDWRNTIIQVGVSKTKDELERPDSLRVSLDYQIYYVPERRYSPALVNEHHDRFLNHVEQLQQGKLAGLASEDRAVHGR